MTDQLGKRTKSFQDFKADLYNAFDDPSVFDCQEFNVLKVVQEGLKCAYSYSTSFGSPLRKIRLQESAKKAVFYAKGGSRGWIQEMKDKVDSIAQRPFLVFDDGTAVKNEAGEDTPVFSARLLEALGRENCVYGRENSTRKRFDVGHDFDIPDLLDHLFLIPITDSDRKLYYALCDTLKTIQAETRFSKEQIGNISCAFEGFWKLYRAANFILENATPRICYLNCHYHKEGIMLAIKRKGVPIVELQHGLIATSDIFYLYPPKVKPIAHKALFADEIWAYGSYWKSILEQGVEYPADKIKIGGYYLYERKEASQELTQLLTQDGTASPKVILVTTQTRLYQYFNEYINWLSEDLVRRNEEAIILVKPHPAAPVETYDVLEGVPKVVLTHESVSSLFPIADVHLSIYSTTLYEATRHHIPNFSLYVKSCADYLADILDSGIATRIEFNQNPLDLLSTPSNTPEPEHFFAPFQAEMMTRNPFLLSPTID